MTEDEAKEKTCPMLFIAAANYSAIRHINKVTSNCLGSDCMMWRKSICRMCGGTGVVAKPVGGDYKACPCECTEKIDDGYCGLAGKP